MPFHGFSCRCMHFQYYLVDLMFSLRSPLEKTKKGFKRFNAQKTLPFISPFSQSEKTRVNIRFYFLCRKDCLMKRNQTEIFDWNENDSIV
jgi:hypothetical protein